jgi:hypothetical protein
MFIEDTRPFFSDFAVEVTLGGVSVRGIFDDAYGESFGGMVAGSGPMFRLPSSVTVTSGDALVHGSATYTVVGIEPDGTGLTLLRLEKA